MRRASIVDEEIEATHSLAYGLEKFVYLVGIRDITTLRGNGETFSLELRDSSFKRLRVAAGNCNPASITGKLAGDSQSDTAASAGYHGSLSV